MDNKIKTILTILLMIICFCTCKATAEQQPTTLLKGGVTVVPQAIYGSWRVISKRVETDNPSTFKSQGIDLWNLILENDVIILSNPFSGASANITIESVEGNKVVFTKIGKYGNKVITDTVNITITGETFEGYDALRLDTISDVNGRIIKTETAKYSVVGEKISGNSILK